MQVVVKLSTTGSGPPVREPMFNEEERKAMMMAEHRRREEVLLRVFVFVLETEKKPTNLNGWHRHTAMRISCDDNIVIQLSYLFQNIVKISLSSKF